ncbi:MAG: DNA-3-methyladenine glycosylase family protein [Oscillospiraceae bacterium]|jgi:N-glycosylase/DNA lyase
MKQQYQTIPVSGFSLKDTLDCGQSFRWEETNGIFSGVAFGRALTIAQQEDKLLLYGVGPDELPFWREYFDLDGDYSRLQELYLTDPVLEQACRFAGGITLLRQEPWEALCSFIISQNNNIPRIKGIVKRLCESFGAPVGPGIHAFPVPEQIAGLQLDDLAPLRAGFRAKYILDAAQKVADGTVDLEAARTLPLEQARAHLMQIMGVGPKVAECALLYGLHRLEAFPVDVWMKRVLERFYPNGFPPVECPGVAQQYLFHSVRCGKLAEPKAGQKNAV